MFKASQICPHNEKKDRQKIKNKNKKNNMKNKKKFGYVGYKKSAK
jgi:hypothetical protein